MAVLLLVRRRADLCGMRVAPAHKGDVNIIRAHWSGKSSTGSWRLDGEVSPGFWGGWGRSRRSQRLYGWRSKLKWGTRAWPPNAAGWPVHRWTVGRCEFQRTLRRPLFAPAALAAVLKAAAGALLSPQMGKKKRDFISRRSSFPLRSSLLPQPFRPRMFWKIFSHYARGANSLRPAAPRARPGSAWMFRWWKESIRESSSVVLVICASWPRCQSPRLSSVPRPSASVVRLANAHHGASWHNRNGSLWQRVGRECNQGLD